MACQTLGLSKFVSPMTVVVGLTSMMLTPPAEAGTYATTNFVVTADSLPLAQGVAELAEEYRRKLARSWMGSDLPDWPTPCRVTYQRGSSGGSGWTTYRLNTNDCRDFRMTLRGEVDRILDYVLPHEVAHTVLVSAVGCAIPRWAEEGVALMSESETERTRQRLRMAELLRADMNFSLGDMLRHAQYPSDPAGLRAFYAISFSVTEFLVAQKGKPHLLNFLRDQQVLGWEQALAVHYRYDDLTSLEAEWRVFAAGTERQQYVVRSLTEVSTNEDDDP